MNTVVYVMRGNVERPQHRKGRAPSYRWTPGYSQTVNGRETQPWMTRNECRTEAKAQGARAVFVGGAA